MRKLNKTEESYIQKNSTTVHGMCDGCKKESFLQKIPLVTHERAFKLRKWELVTLDENYVGYCNKCSSRWIIEGIVSKRKLLNLIGNLKFLKIHDQERFRILVVAIERISKEYYLEISTAFHNPEEDEVQPYRTKYNRSI